MASDVAGVSRREGADRDRVLRGHPHALKKQTFLHKVIRQTRATHSTRDFHTWPTSRESRREGMEERKGHGGSKAHIHWHLTLAEV
jgi:hypothetical protein